MSLFIINTEEMTVFPIKTANDLPERLRQDIKDELHDELYDDIKQNITMEIQSGIDSFIQDVQSAVDDLTAEANSVESLLDNGFEVDDFIG